MIREGEGSGVGIGNPASTAAGQNAETIPERRHNEKRVENQNEHIVIRINTPDKQEFVDNYRDAVLDTFMLLFERRELDLCEGQLYSLYLLAQSAKSAAVYRQFPPTSPSA